MRVPTTLCRAVLLSASLLSTLALAQGSAVLTGTVTDAATNKPIADVVVTARSPALQGEQIVVTDATGLYRIPQLPPGTYELSFDKETYKAFKRPEIAVRIDRTVKVNIQLQPDAVQGETVVVVGRPPTVDVGSTTMGVSVGKEFIQNVAFVQAGGTGVRSFESLAAVAPQVVGDDYGYGFSGAQSPENLYLVDGVSVGNASNGTNAGMLPVDFFEEANVITGSYQAEYGRATGGVINAVTKSGSNEFHGNVWGNWAPGALALNPKEVTTDNSIEVYKHKMWNSGDFGVDVGGPIIKDKLWFYVGFSPSFYYSHTERSYRRFLFNEAGTDFQYDDQGFVKSEKIAGTQQWRGELAQANSYIGKLTYLINSDNNLSLTVSGSPSTYNNPRSFTDRRVQGWNGGGTFRSDTMSVSAKYAGAFMDKHLLVDASVGFFRVQESYSPNDKSKLDWTKGVGATGTPSITYRRLNTDPNVGSVKNPYSIADFEDLTALYGAEVAAACEAPKVTMGQSKIVTTQQGYQRFLMHCPVSSYTIGGLGYMEDTTVDRLQARGALTYMMQAAGHHVWKTGLDVEQNKYDVLKGYSGGDAMRENITGSRIDDYRQFGYLAGPDDPVLQKTVHSTPSSLGVGAYLQDSWQVMDLVTVNAGLRYENQQLFAADGTMGLTLNNMLSPRLGVIYDFTQQGRSKVFANYARYYESVPLTIADRSLTGENQYSYRHVKSTAGGSPGCDPLKDINQALNECQSDKTWQPINTIGGDYYANQYGTLTGAGRTPIDPNLQPQSMDEVVVGGEYEIIADGRLGATYTMRRMVQIIEDMSNDEGSTYFIGNPGVGLGSEFPKAQRDYDAVTASFTKAFSEGWMAQLSYTWSRLYGNWAGLYRPETGQLDPNINSDFDLKSLMANRTGLLDGNRTHFIKGYASKVFPVTSSFDLVLGLSYVGRSGSPINYLAGHPVYGPDEAFILPRGSGGELPWTHTFNGKLIVKYKLNRDQSIALTADVFNLLNLQAVTAVDQTLSNESMLPVTVPAGTTPAKAICIDGSANCTTSLQKIDAETGEIVPATTADFNSNYKRPIGYQQPLSVRFGVKFTF